MRSRLHREYSALKRSFFTQSWQDNSLMRQYIAAFNLKHFPARTTRVCSDHFDDDCFLFDVHHIVAPHL